MNYIEILLVVYLLFRYGTNRTFYFQGTKKATSAVDLVIVNIPEGFSVPRISTPPSSIPSWNAKSDKFLFIYLFCIQYLHNDDVLLIFHSEDPK